MPEPPLGTSPLDPAAAQSLPQVIAQRNGQLALLATEELSRLLPGLTVPQGWFRAGSGALATTRMLLRRVGTASYWDGCESLNLYRVPGTVPGHALFANADRALRHAGAHNLHTVEVQSPPAYPMVTARVTGDIVAGSRLLRAQYTYHVVQSTGATALIEQVIVVGQDLADRLMPEVQALTASLYRSLLSSIDLGRGTDDAHTP